MLSTTTLDLCERPPALDDPRLRPHPGDGPGAIVEQGNRKRLLAARGGLAGAGLAQRERRSPPRRKARRTSP